MTVIIDVGYCTVLLLIAMKLDANNDEVDEQYHYDIALYYLLLISFYRIHTSFDVCAYRNYLCFVDP